jgi:titin
VIRGLSNGTAYTFIAKAQLATWQTAASPPSSSVTPATTPDAPTSLVATANNGGASIAFNAGATNGSTITNYEYSTDNGGSWTTRSPASTESPLVITGLTNGTTYQIKLRAINGVGTGAASSAVSVTLAAPAPDPAPASAAQSAPTKPAAVWSSSTAAKTVTAVITPTTGVTYGLTAKSGSATKSGACKNVTPKQGSTNVTRRSCTIKLGKGTWLVSVTPTKGGVAGAAATKSYAFK